MTKTIKEVNITRLAKDKTEEVKDCIIKEVPFTIFINDKEYATLMCTPDNLDYLTIGFLSSEGLLKSPDDIESLDIQETGSARVKVKNGINLDKRFIQKRIITSGCGKGSIFYDLMKSIDSKKIDSSLTIPKDSIISLMKQLEGQSNLFKSTGGVHSSALCNKEEIIIFHEDIGRHNAIDKVFGEALLKKVSFQDKIILTSGRTSSEILLKVARRRVPILVSRSAPTDLAGELAQQAGVTLIGFARRSRMNIYTNNRRIT